MNRFLYIIFFAVLFCSCQQKTWTIKESSFEAIPIDASTDAIADQEYLKHIEPAKEEINLCLQHVIGAAAETMPVQRPESLLSNFCADVYREAATDYLQQEVDIAIVNMGGLRIEIPAGDITLRDIFELMPFENELVILWLKGSDVERLLNAVASVGGEGISGVRMGIRGTEAADITINGKTLDNEKRYTIATNDFLAEGNDKLTPLADHEKKLDTGLKIRDVMIDYIKQETAKGHEIKSNLDGRIKLLFAPKKKHKY